MPRSAARRAARAACAASAVVLAAMLAACDIGEIVEVEEAGWRDAGPDPVSWEQVLAAPVPLDVTAYVTGEVLAGPGILIDPDVDGVPAVYGETIWVPALSYLVRHPSGQTVLMDAGLRPGDCAYRVVLLIQIGCRNEPGQDVVSQLAADSVTRLDYLLVSHFHGDHVSGLAGVLAAYDPTVLTTRGEIDGIRSPLREIAGYKRDQLTGAMRVEPVDMALLGMAPLDGAADLFGDGSVWLVATPGHTAGHLSALLNVPGGPLLFTFDAAHLAATFDYVAPGGLWHDPDTGAASIRSLRSFAETHPATRVIFGHEPAQWAGKGPRVALAGEGSY